MANIIHLEGDILEIKGATKVTSCVQNQAVIETGDNLIIASGIEIEVKKLNLEEGEVSIQGKITNIKLGTPSSKKMPFLKRIFK